MDNGAILEPDQDVAGDNLDPQLPLQELPDANKGMPQGTDLLPWLDNAQAPH